MTDEEIESYNNQKFCHICRKLHDVDDSDEVSDDDSNDNSDDDDVFEVQKFYGDVVEPELMLMVMMIVIVMMIYLMPESFMVML